VQEQNDGFLVRLLDFDDVSTAAMTKESAVRAAQDALLRKILSAMRSDHPIPAPDQYLELIDERHIVMIDPLHAETHI
jgi:predicted RNase H-like HicB family nuclease